MDRFEYDPTSNRWSGPVDATGSPPGIDHPIWTGTEILVPAWFPWRAGVGPPETGLQGAELGPDAKVSRPIAHGPADDAAGPSVWTGSTLIRLLGDGDASASATGGAWDIQSGKWYDLPRAPLGATGATVSVWTGHQLLMWGDLYPPRGPRLPVAEGLSLTPR